MIYDKDGNELPDIPLSERNQHALEADGGKVVVLYHTPQLLRGAMGTRSGSFTLRRIGDRIVSDDPSALREYAEMQPAAAELRRRVFREPTNGEA